MLEQRELQAIAELIDSRMSKIEEKLEKVRCTGEESSVDILVYWIGI